MFACPDADASAVRGSSPMAAEMKASPQQRPEIKPDPAPPTDDAPPVTPVKVKQEPLEDDGAEERCAGALSWRGLGAAVSNSLSTPTNVSPAKTCNASSNSVQSVRRQRTTRTARAYRLRQMQIQISATCVAGRPGPTSPNFVACAART